MINKNKSAGRAACHRGRHGPLGNGGYNFAGFSKQDFAALGKHLLQDDSAIAVQEQAQGRLFGALQVADFLVDVSPALFLADAGTSHDGKAALAGTGFCVDGAPRIAQPFHGLLAGREGRCLL